MSIDTSASEEVLEALPHRPPFLFIDEIVELGEEGIQAKKHISAEEDFFRGHYPGKPIMPGVLLCECVFQAGALYLAKRQGAFAGESGVPVVTRVSDVKFKNPVYPNSVLEIQASFSEKVASAFFMTGKITCAGKKVLTLSFACTVMENS